MLKNLTIKCLYSVLALLTYATTAVANESILVSTQCGTLGSYPAIAIRVDNNSKYTFNSFLINLEVFHKNGDFLEEKTYLLDSLRPRRHGIEQATLTNSKGVLCSDIGSLEFFLDDAIRVNEIRPYGKLDPNPEMTKAIEGMLMYKSLDPASFYVVKESEIPHGS